MSLLVLILPGLVRILVQIAFGLVHRGGPVPILYENSLNLKTISQSDFGHFRENNRIIVSQVAKIDLRDYF